MDGQPNCKFFVERKGRFCKFASLSDSEYCGEHQPVGAESRRGKRIPCPYDGAHTVFEAELCAHLRVCNSRPRKLLYQKPGVNMPQESNASLVPAEKPRFIDVCKVEHLLPLLKSVVGPWMETADISPPKINCGIPRDEQQTTAIARQIPSDLLKEYALIEIGAGKARLAYRFVQINSHALPKRVYLVDKSRPRAKCDRKIEAITGHTERLHIDLKDLDLSVIPLEMENIVIIAKHACGAATDFSLTAIGRLTEVYPTRKFHVAIATCCHHACSAETFCDQRVFDRFQISPEQLCLLTRVSSWSVCDIVNDECIGGMKKSLIGRYAKWFIDLSRCNYLESCGLESNLKCYIDRSISPENFLIYAVTPTAIESIIA